MLFSLAGYIEVLECDSEVALFIRQRYIVQDDK
jgi:hypothetical protein